MKRTRRIGLGMTALVAAALACNFPGVQAPLLPTREGISGPQLRQTLAALQTPSPAPLPSRTLRPGETPLAATALPTFLPTALAQTATAAAPQGRLLYLAQPGDTLPALAGRFGVAAEQIQSPQSLPAAGLIPPGQALFIPDRLEEPRPYAQPLLPDAEVINSPAAAGYDVARFVQQAGGYLSNYQENFNGEILTGVQSIERVASEASINPRLLLAVLEYRSGWVYGQPANQDQRDYPLGFHVTGSKGLYRELVMAATHLNLGYYGWRSGATVTAKATDGVTFRLHPALNAGSIAVQNLMAKFYPSSELPAVLEGPEGLLAQYQALFGDPWVRANQLGPLFPPGLSQPALELPFPPGERWSLTGGPHASWKTGSPRGALDLAPVTGEAECAVSRAWVTAPAAGLVVRARRNAVALDLDGDGFEQTGWVIVFYHLAQKDLVAEGSRLQLDDRLGHPSCEGGRSTGTHVHIARKYNGEWLAAGDPLPFMLSGWLVVVGEKEYTGELRKDEQVVVASPLGPRTSIVVR